jgi:CheY-like chemotaxis protein
VARRGGGAAGAQVVLASRLEARMLHAQKLESLGVLAGGIAHDFNNLLVGILGNVGLALRELPADTQAEPLLRDVQRAAGRAAELTAQMLAYAGKGRITVEAVNLNAVVAEIAGLLAAVISKKATLRTDFASGAAGRRRRRDADPPGGDEPDHERERRARRAQRDDHGPHVDDDGRPRAAGDQLRRRTAARGPLRVPVGGGRRSGDGCGDAGPHLRPVLHDQVRGPRAGAGGGPGHPPRAPRGDPPRERAGRGACFTVLLPCAEGARAVPAADSGIRPRLGDGGMVLVADDEPAVRSVARRVLERAGYRVCVAGDGRAALEVFTAHAAEISAVLIDLTMPQLRGDEVIRELRRMRPDVRVVLSSGFVENRGARALEHVRFLPKPWTPEDLLAAVDWRPRVVGRISRAVKGRVRRPRPHGRQGLAGDLGGGARDSRVGVELERVTSGRAAARSGSMRARARRAPSRTVAVSWDRLSWSAGKASGTRSEPRARAAEMRTIGVGVGGGGEELGGEALRPSPRRPATRAAALRWPAMRAGEPGGEQRVDLVGGAAAQAADEGAALVVVGQLGDAGHGRDVDAGGRRGGGAGCGREWRGGGRRRRARRGGWSQASARARRMRRGDRHLRGRGPARGAGQAVLQQELDGAGAERVVGDRGAAGPRRVEHERVADAVDLVVELAGGDVEHPGGLDQAALEREVVGAHVGRVDGGAHDLALADLELEQSRGRRWSGCGPARGCSRRAPAGTRGSRGSA